MALTSLPYPSMDFVPLDVLTADELDQIVANINAINNNALVPTASIADGAVTNQKIANATIALSKIDFSTATILTGNTPSIELTAGHWLIFASATVLSNVESGSFASDISWLGITKDFQGYRASNENRPSSDISFFAERTINATTTYTCTATTGAQIYQENWLAIKLG